jgi:hypothetical protein
MAFVPIQALDQGQKFQVPREGSSVGAGRGADCPGGAPVFIQVNVHDDFHRDTVDLLAHGFPWATP